MAWDKTHATAPGTVLILGGGRWARTLTGVVSAIMPSRTRITVCSPSGAADMRHWATGRDLGPQIRVLSELPEDKPVGPTAVLVANAARSHVSSVLWALGYGESVLVEKPVALTRPRVRQLIDAADRRGRFLAPAQVLLFCRYLRSFAADLAGSGPVAHVALDWSDPTAERRDGEVKTYDTSVPVFADVLPHVLSILSAVFSQVPERGMLTEVRRGGAEVVLRLFLNGFDCDVVLARDAAIRRRRLVVTQRQSQTSLDWSIEPGRIRDAAGERTADPFWNRTRSPITQLLHQFLNSPDAARRDSRFGMEIALKAASLTDRIYPEYVAALVNALAREIAALGSIHGNSRDAPEHLRYGLRELVQSEGSITRAEAADKAACLLDDCSGMSEAGIWQRLDRFAASTLECDPGCRPGPAERRPVDVANASPASSRQ